MKQLSDTLQDGKLKLKAELKKSIFDVVALAIIAALMLASLDAFDLVDLSSFDTFAFIVGWLPYFLASMLLSSDLYKKGVFVGKRTDKFESVANSYNELVSSLTGQQIRDLTPFCKQYNEEALVNLRTSILKEGGIDYSLFEEKLKVLTKEQLLREGYNKEQIKAIKFAKKARVKGINVNILMSSMDLADPTNIGKGEQELEKQNFTFSIIKYLASTILMSFIVTKDISAWGWSSLIGTSFKVMYVFAKSFMSYFAGYDNMTISVLNHIARKTDILKTYVDYIPQSAVEEEVIEA